MPDRAYRCAVGAAILGLLTAAALQGADGEAATAAVTGRVVFDGPAPRATTLNLGADPACGRLHEGAVPDNEVIVNGNGTLKNVLVYVKDGLGDRKFNAPAGPVVIDQVGCVYTPRVVAVQVGQQVTILNSDPTLHNVNSRSRANRQFNTGMPQQGSRIQRTFAAPEILELRCQVHRWMRAIVGVFDHPFATVTGDDGTFTLPDLPPGEYTIEAWHERYGTQTARVTVGAGPSAPVVLRFRG